MPVVVKEQDHGASKLIKDLSMTAVIRVGIQGQKASEAKENGKGLTVADVATFHEFGTFEETIQAIPRRSFIADYVDQNVEKIERRLRNLAKQVASGKIDIKTALNQFGTVTQAEMQARIATGIPPPLATSTLKRKKSKTTPLIDTGQLRSSITYEIVMHGGSVSVGKIMSV